MRGDPPSVAPGDEAVTVSTPHARGSTSTRQASHRQGVVYPACAGIHLIQNGQLVRVNRLPRMRGDPPVFPSFAPTSIMSTPHARGSTPAPE